MTKLTLLHTVVVLHFTHNIKNGMIGHGGERCQHAQNPLL